MHSSVAKLRSVLRRLHGPTTTESSSLAYQDLYIKGKRIQRGTLDTLSIYSSWCVDIDFAGKSYLDLGCNAGAYAFLAADDGATRVVGVDLVNEHILEAKAYLKHYSGRSLEFVTADLFAFLSEHDARYDIVSAIALVRHLIAQKMQAGAQPEDRRFNKWMTFDSFQKIVRRRDPVAAGHFDAVVNQLIAFSMEHFIFSMQDRAGGFLRNKPETIDRLRALNPRIQNCEIFAPSSRNPHHVFFVLSLSPNR